MLFLIPIPTFILIAAVIIILGIAIFRFRDLYYRLYLKEKSTIIHLKTLIEKWDENDSGKMNHERITEELESGGNLNDYLFKVWREFHESLVFYENTVENTVDSHHFFNIDRLSPNVFSREAFKVTPNILVGLGVLFTFVGLVIGLRDLNFDTDPNELQQGIETIIKGATLAFISSIFGILSSLLFLGRYSKYKSVLKREILFIQNEIDFRYPKTNPEKSLVNIRDYTKEQSNILGALSETIGDKLQEVVRGIQQDLKGEIGNMTQSVNYFLENIQQNAENRAESSMEILVEKFLERLGSSIKSQKELIDDTNHAIKEMLKDFNSRFLIQVEGLKEVLEKLNESYHVVEHQLVGKFSDSVEKLENGINEFLIYQKILEKQLAHQDNTVSDLQFAVVNFKEATENFATTYQNIVDTHNHTVANLNKAFENLEEISNANASVSERMSQLIQSLKSPLDLLKEGFEQMRAIMDEQFQKMSSNMNNALNSYFRQVETQTNERLNEWNKQTYEFSAAMLGTVKELNSSVDTFKEKKIEDYNKSVEIQEQSLQKMNQWTDESKDLISNMEKFSNDLVNISKSLDTRIQKLDELIQNPKKNESPLDS